MTAIAIISSIRLSFLEGFIISIHLLPRKQTSPPFLQTMPYTPQVMATKLREKSEKEEKMRVEYSKILQ